jgi:hypothetical protein
MPGLSGGKKPSGGATPNAGVVMLSVLVRADFSVSG